MADSKCIDESSSSSSSSCRAGFEPVCRPPTGSTAKMVCGEGMRGEGKGVGRGGGWRGKMGGREKGGDDAKGEERMGEVGWVEVESGRDLTRGEGREKGG